MSAPLVRLTLKRDWVLYAFAPETIPTDERGILLGEEELAQIIEPAIGALFMELQSTKKELAAVRAELDALHDAHATLKRNVVVSQLKG